MTIPFERTRALVQTRAFLEAMLDPKQTPRTPGWMRKKARALLRHYPGLVEIEKVHLALPTEFGPAPPFSRLSGSVAVRDVLEGVDVNRGELDDFVPAPPSVVDLIAKEHGAAGWIQNPAQHSFNDELGGDTLYSEKLSKPKK